MRTRPAHIGPGCVYCNEDHNPDIECRYLPESVRFQLAQTKPARPTPRRIPIKDASGKTIAVRTVWEE